MASAANPFVVDRNSSEPPSIRICPYYVRNFNDVYGNTDRDTWNTDAGVKVV